MVRIKKFFKRGNGELLGFAVCLPAFTFLLVLIVTIAQIALAKEHLEYCAYTAARSAVVAENFDDALDNANAIVEEMREQGGYSSASVQIIINGAEVSSGDSVAWNKGVFITVKVTFHVDTFIDSLSGDRSASIVMMVERPAAAGGDIL